MKSIKNIFRSIKESMWRIGLKNNCPWCGSDLEMLGYAVEFWQHYRCSNHNCKFGKKDDRYFPPRMI